MHKLPQQRREDVVESGHGASMHMAASSRARSVVAKVSLECACLGQVTTMRPRVSLYHVAHGRYICSPWGCDVTFGWHSCSHMH